MDLTGKVAVVTGSGRGLGLAYAKALAAAGAAVVVNDVDPHAAELAVKEIEETGGRAAAVVAPVGPTETADALVAKAVEEFGRIDVWVNNAAVSFFSPFLEVPMRDFERVIDVNLMGYVYGSRAALERMQDQGAGVLVNVASIVGEIPQPYTSAYSVSKAAVRALGR